MSIPAWVLQGDEPPTKRWRELVDRWLEAPASRRELMDVHGLSRHEAHAIVRYRSVLGVGREASPKAEAPADPKGRVEVAGDGEHDLTLASKGRQVRTLEDLLEAAEVDSAVWRVSKWRANVWHQHSGGVTVPLHQVKADLVRRVLPLRAPDYPPAPTWPPTREPDDARVVLLIPDTHHGLRWTDRRYGSAIPTQDVAAIDAVWQLAADLQPDEIHLLGDHLDAPESGTYELDWSLRGTHQAGLDLLGHDLWRLRRACPESRIVYHGGNHEVRILRSLRRGAPELEGLGHLPDLLGLDALGIDYAGDYGEEGSYVEAHGHRLRVEHGRVIGPGGGGTVAKILKGATESVAFGHIHRAEMAWRTVWGPDGDRQLLALSPGTLARLGGVLPGASRREDWQQGCAVIEIDAAGLHPRLVRVAGGRLRDGGRVYVGRDDLESIAAATGWGQLVA